MIKVSKLTDALLTVQIFNEHYREECFERGYSRLIDLGYETQFLHSLAGQLQREVDILHEMSVNESLIRSDKEKPY